MAEEKVSAMESFLEALQAELAENVETAPPTLPDSPDPAFEAWAKSVNLNAAELYAPMLAKSRAENAERDRLCDTLGSMIDILEAMPQGVGEFTVRRTAAALTITVGSITRSVSLNGGSVSREEPATRTISQKWGSNGGSGSAIRIIAVKNPELEHLVGRTYSRGSGGRPATIELGYEIGLFTAEQYDDQKVWHWGSNKVASNGIAWIRVP